MALSRVPGIGPIAGKQLISYCGSAKAAFSEKKKVLAAIPGIGQYFAGAITSFTDFNRIADEIEFAEKNQIRIVGFTNPEYPVRLKQELDGPLVLYVKGTADLNANRIAGVIGTRRNTLQGADQTRKLVEELLPYQVAIASGLAYGIDIIAHRSCLDYKIPTLAVLAHGLDTVYPSSHTIHARKIVDEGGALISEHMSGTALNPDLFPRRNRIVAALCDCIIVVESQRTGGSMITAEIASSYNRDVFAFPGRPQDSMSEGCNYLIKSLKAAMCESGEDVAKGMNWEIPDQKTKVTRQNLMFEDLTTEERKITELVSPGELVYDELLVQSQIPVHKLSFMLLDLEMRGIIRSLPGKKYSIYR